MSPSRFTESDIEEADLTWLKYLGWQITHGPDIAPDTPSAERSDYSEVVLAQRLRDSLVRLNPDLPITALEDAYRKLIHPEGSTLEARNRTFHRHPVEGVTVEYRTADGRIQGAQVGVIESNRADFANGLLLIEGYGLVTTRTISENDA